LETWYSWAQGRALLWQLWLSGKSAPKELEDQLNTLDSLRYCFSSDEIHHYVYYRVRDGRVTEASFCLIFPEEMEEDSWSSPTRSVSLGAGADKKKIVSWVKVPVLFHMLLFITP
jgi:hypothetical protein